MEMRRGKEVDGHEKGPGLIHQNGGFVQVRDQKAPSGGTGKLTSASTELRCRHRRLKRDGANRLRYGKGNHCIVAFASDNSVPIERSSHTGGAYLRADSRLQQCTNLATGPGQRLSR